MSLSPFVLFAIIQDILAIIYTLWVASLSNPTPILRRIGFVLLGWLIFLHLGLSSKTLLPADISSIGFLMVIVFALAAVGALLLLIRPIRYLLLNLDQQYLLLFQGIRVFYGAGFLMQASLGVLPQTFGILDGWTHVSAGFFGLIAAFSLAIGNQGVRRAWFANLFGLLDILIVASTLALVLLPKITPFHPMMYALFLPAPLWFWFHIISIWKLLRDRSTLPSSEHTSTVHL